MDCPTVPTSVEVTILISIRGISGKAALGAAVLFACGALTGHAIANAVAPTEHRGLQVEKLGYVPEDSMSAQVGLAGHILLLRKITINPGGQIAKHSAAKTPGVVYVASGTWTEGRENGETEHSAGDTFVEDKDTVHWFYNRGKEPATAYVCDIKPAS